LYTIGISLFEKKRVNERKDFLTLIRDLYVLFIRKIRAFNPPFSDDSISDFEDYTSIINIYLFLLGGTLALNELHFDREEKRSIK